MQKKPPFKAASDGLGTMVRHPHHDDSKIKSNIVPSKLPSHSGGQRLSRKYYVTPAKESPEVARLRPDCMRDKVVTSSDTHPKWDLAELKERRASNTPMHKGKSGAWEASIHAQHYLGPHPVGSEPQQQMTDKGKKSAEWDRIPKDRHSQRESRAKQ